MGVMACVLDPRQGEQEGERGGCDEQGGQRPGVIPAAAVAVDGGGEKAKGEAAAGFGR